MGKTIKKIWNAITTLLVIVVVLGALLLVGVRLIGFNVFTVLSGSMEPTYHTGAILYVKDVDYRQLATGDVITYMLNEDTVATHRIVEVIPDENDSTVIRYRTKGDANNVADGGLVHYRNVIGSPVFSIPYLGYVANYIQNPPGTYIAISAGAILLLLVFLPDLFADDKPKKKKKDEEEVREEESPEELPEETIELTSAVAVEESPEESVQEIPEEITEEVPAEKPAKKKKEKPVKVKKEKPAKEPKPVREKKPPKKKGGKYLKK